jgi:hypothetical protein
MAFPHDGNKFKKGQSGNPKGRPKGSLNRSTIIRKWLQAESDFKNPLTGEMERMTLEDSITLSQLAQAGKGSTNAYKALLDSAYGAPKQEIETTGTQDVHAYIDWFDTEEVNSSKQ